MVIGDRGWLWGAGGGYRGQGGGYREAGVVIGGREWL